MPNAPTPGAQRLEDPLSFLPCSTTVEYRQGELIFAPGQTSSRLFVIIHGFVKVSREVSSTREVVVDIYKSDEFFGESALVHQTYRTEKATALTRSAVMSWEIEEVEDLIRKRPTLGIAIAQLLALRDSEFVDRIESLTTESAITRVARTLLRFGGRLGERDTDGTLRMPPLTHELIAETIGTSREVVTGHMNDLRRQGYLRYSRLGIILADGALRDWMQRRTDNDQA